MILSLIRRIRDYNNRLDCVHMCETTYDWITHSFHYIASVDGEVGAGKSSFECGCSHYYALYFQSMAQSKIEWAMKVIPEADYVFINNLIVNYYEETGDALNVFDRLMEDENIKNCFDGYYSDYVTTYERKAILRIYCEASCALLRNRYVASNIRVYNRVTNNWSYNFNSNDLDIKDPDIQKKYNLLRYCFYFEDETATSKYTNLNNKVKSDDFGKDEALRLWRHLTDETSVFHSASQNTSRIALFIREISNVYLHIKGLKIEGFLKAKDKKFAFKERRLDFYERVHAWFRRKKDPSYRSRFNKYKEKKLKVFQKRKKIFASSYVNYHVLLYTKEEDIGKKIDKCVGFADEFDCYFPLTWVFGVYQSTEFSYVDDYLKSISNISDFDLEVAKATLTELEKEIKSKMLLQKVNSSNGKKKNVEIYADDLEDEL